MSTSDSFQDNYNSAQTTVKTVSVGVIVAIVVVVLACLGSVIAAFCLWNRNKKRRAARNAAFEPMNSVSAYQYGNDIDRSSMGNDRNQGAAASAFPPSPYSGQTELHGSNVKPRYEMPYTPAPYPEAPNNEVRHEKPYDNGHAELGGKPSTRSELQA
ncbi:hypothetical protein SCUP515_08244 [Seiridium cupressi]